MNVVRLPDLNAIYDFAILGFEISLQFSLLTNLKISKSVNQQ